MDHAAVIQALAADPYWGSAINAYPLDALRESGFCTPVEGIIKDSRDNPSKYYGGVHSHPYIRFIASEHIDLIRKHAQTGDATILVATGSYAPMHQGHINFMEAADLAARAEGLIPVAAVFSLHSDEHVRSKIIPVRPDAPIAAETRYEMAADILPDTLPTGTPVFIDRWDSAMPQGPRAFTDVMIRLVNTLASFGIRNVEPTAVFGSDNASSMRAFCRYGRAICVLRPRYEHEADTYRNEPQMRRALREHRVLIATRPNDEDISSTDIRNNRAPRP
jgi:nicotinic acid mononucleotide adenylyltransferase